MAIPVILKGETSKPIRLALKEGYEYEGCALRVDFCGLRDTFVDLAAGGSVELRYTAEQTAGFPLGTSKVALSIKNARGEICFMPWAKIKVTDCPEDVRDAQIIIDPATLNVDDLTPNDTLASVKSRLNAVMAFLRCLSSLALLALPLGAMANVEPVYTTLNDMPGDAKIMTNVTDYMDAKIVELAPKTSLKPATNYTDSALHEFARTNAVLKAGPYVKRDSTTPSGQTLGGGFRVKGWISSTGTVSVVRDGPSLLEVRKPQTWMDFDCFGLGWGTGGWVFDKDGFHRQFQEFPMGSWALGPAFSFPEDAYETGGVLALRSDIPDTSGYATPEDVTAAIREQSLGGIWDEALQVWWTPIMQNGALRYVATTNVDLSAEGNQ